MSAPDPPPPATSGAGRYAPSPSGDLHLGNLRTAILAWALARHGQVETVGFDYGQRHGVEMDQRQVVLICRLDRQPAQTGHGEHRLDEHRAALLELRPQRSRAPVEGQQMLERIPRDA